MVNKGADQRKKQNVVPVRKDRGRLLNLQLAEHPLAPQTKDQEMTITKKRTVPMNTSARQEVSAKLDTAIESYSSLKAQIDDLQQLAKDKQSEVLSLMEELGAESVVAETETGKWQATRVESSTTELDEPRLKKLVGASVWTKITTRQLDKGKLDSAIKSGEVSPVDLADASETTPRAPFIRLTRKK